MSQVTFEQEPEVIRPASTEVAEPPVAPDVPRRWSKTRLAIILVAAAVLLMSVLIAMSAVEVLS